MRPRYTVLRKPAGGSWVIFDNERNEEAAIKATRREARAHVRELNATARTMKKDAEKPAQR